jgi:hypothetical protein
MSTLADHGLIYVSLGGNMIGEQMQEVEETRGGSFSGAGTIVGAMGQRQPSKKGTGDGDGSGGGFLECSCEGKSRVGGLALYRVQ